MEKSESQNTDTPYVYVLVRRDLSVAQRIDILVNAGINQIKTLLGMGTLPGMLLAGPNTGHLSPDCSALAKRVRKMSTNVSTRTLKFHLSKNHFRRFEFRENGKTFSICHMYPTLLDYRAGQIPDNVNPRTHEDNVLKGSVPDEIRETIIEKPEEMILANRGATVTADRVQYDPDTEQVTLVLTKHDDRDTALHGMADGATSDAVIAQVQEALTNHLTSVGKMTLDETLDYSHLAKARFHLQVFVGLDDREAIKSLSRGRNRSKSVKPWSIADWGGEFNWLKDILESNAFKGKIGYEENAGKSVNILEVIALMTLFHPMYEGKVLGDSDRHPTVAYSSKGTMSSRFLDEEMKGGYQSLAPIVEDILRLHDHVSSGFANAYQQTKGEKKGRLGALGSKENRVFAQRTHDLPLTGVKTDYSIPDGVLYPVLASLRCLIDFKTGKAKWRIDPFEFWTKNGAFIVETVIELLSEFDSNPQTFGKKSYPYKALRQTAMACRNEGSY